MARISKKREVPVVLRKSDAEIYALQMRRRIADVGVRQAAKDHLEIGIFAMMRAFNLCNDPEKPWAYAPDVQERVKLLIGELMSVFDTSTLIGQGNAAKIDAGFQRFIAGLNLKNI